MNPSLLQLQHILKRHKIDALLISQPENRRFLSGFSATDHSINESSGYLLIPKQGTPFLLTDARYHLQAHRDVSGFDIVIYTRGFLLLLKSLLHKLRVKTLAFEANYLLYNKYLSLTKVSQTLALTLIPFDGHVERLRLSKSAQELAAIKRSVALNETCFQQIFPTIKPGQTEIDIALSLENAMRQLGAERPSFDTIVASGPNGALPHAVPSHRRILKNEPVIIDMGLILDGYCSDMTRTIVLGTPDNDTIQRFRLVRQAQLAGLAALRPGVTGREVDSAARSIIRRAGYGPHFGHSLGHGVGLAVHENPSLSHRNRSQLKSGMVVTVEPGIYLPEWGGIRLENMAVITEHGHELLNKDTTFLDL